MISTMMVLNYCERKLLSVSVSVPVSATSFLTPSVAFNNVSGSLPLRFQTHTHSAKPRAAGTPLIGSVCIQHLSSLPLMHLFINLTKLKICSL